MPPRWGGRERRIGACQSSRLAVRAARTLRRFVLPCLLLGAALGVWSPVRAETVVFTSLEWPPYTSASLPQHGASAEIAAKAFEAVGMTLRIEFYPWMRTVETARRKPGVAGYFPEYHAKRIEAEFLFSDAMGESPLGFVERRAAPIAWTRLKDLAEYRIGVVEGYVNEARFDAMANRGALSVEPVKDDATNLRKLAGGRIDLAVMDKYVFRYLMAHEPSLQAHADSLQFNPRLLDMKTLHLCFLATEDGARLRRRFNAGLSKLDPRALQQAYMERMLAGVGGDEAHSRGVAQ